jgi:hypothetical protein
MADESADVAIAGGRTEVAPVDNVIGCPTYGDPCGATVASATTSDAASAPAQASSGSLRVENAVSYHAINAGDDVAIAGNGATAGSDAPVGSHGALAVPEPVGDEYWK